MQFEPFTFKIIGETPLLMHSPKGMFLQNDKKTSRKVEAVPNPEEEAELAAYRNEEGYLVFPSIAVRNALLKAAKPYRHQKTRKSMATYLAHMRSTEEWMLLVNPETGEPLKEYEIDLRRVVVNRGQSAVIRARPRINRWAGEVTFLVLLEALGLDWEETQKLLLQFLEEAGKLVGLGDFRPERGGMFGLCRPEAV